MHKDTGKVEEWAKNNLMKCLNRDLDKQKDMVKCMKILSKK